jgi:hypothetical protein
MSIEFVKKTVYAILRWCMRQAVTLFLDSDGSADGSNVHGADASGLCTSLLRGQTTHTSGMCSGAR